MKKDLIVLVDMDGVQANYNELLHERWEDKHPNKPLDQQKYGLYHKIEDAYPEYKPLFDEIVNEPSFFRDLRPIEGAIEGSKYFASRVLTFTCTKPSNYNPNCAWAKTQWIGKHFGEEWRKKRLLIVRDKTIVRGDYLIDDNPDIAKEGSLKPLWEQIIFNQPYNKNSNHRLRMNSDWSNVEEIVDIIERS